MARKNISIGLDTWQELAALGRFGMTFDDIVKILLTEHRELDKLRSRLQAQEVEPEQAIRDLFNEVDKVTPPAGYYRAAFGATKIRHPQQQPPTQPQQPPQQQQQYQQQADEEQQRQQQLQQWEQMRQQQPKQFRDIFKQDQARSTKKKNENEKDISLYIPDLEFPANKQQIINYAKKAGGEIKPFIAERISDKTFENKEELQNDIVKSFASNKELTDFVKPYKVVDCEIITIKDAWHRHRLTQLSGADLHA